MCNGALLALVLTLAPALTPPQWAMPRGPEAARHLLLEAPPVPDHASTKARQGFAAHYKPGLMEQVARNRGLPVVDCMIAADGRIGQWLKVRSRLNGNVERCRITDVCAPRDCGRIRKAGIIVEFGWPSAKRVCEVRRYGEKRPRDCPVELL